MIDKVSQTERLSTTCAVATTPAAPSTVLSRGRAFYDTYVDDSSFGLAPTVGDVVRTEALETFSGTTPNYTLVSRQTFDGNGRVLTATDALDHTATTSYTTANGGLVTQTVATNAKDQPVTTTFHPAWAQPTRVVNENNANTELTYDGLGRLTGVWAPGRNAATQSPSFRFTYLIRQNGPPAVTAESLLPSGTGYVKSIDLYDGFLRQRQNQRQATGGGRTLTDTVYNTLGQVAYTNNAYYDSTDAAPDTALGQPQGQVPSRTAYEYDGAGRVTATALVANGLEKWRTTTAYGGDRTHWTPPQGGTASTTITDVRGQTTAVRQYRSFADVGSANPATYDQVAYTYTLQGQLATMTDAAGNVWSYTYDLRGRETQRIDPDSGTTTSTYDLVGNVATTTGPFGTTTATTAYTYDELDRRITMREDSISGTVRAKWAYDTILNGKGKLASATRYVGGQPYVSRVDSYDVFSRPTSTSLVLPATESTLCAAASPNTCTYTTATTYKANGQPSTATMPAAADLPSEKLTYGYTDTGAEGTVFSPLQIYVDGVSYDKLGQFTQRVLGDSSLNKHITQTMTYDEPTRRLATVSVLAAGQPEAANWSYLYHNSGSVKQIREAPAGGTADIQCYGYDYSSHLKDAWTTASGDCGATPTVWGQVGGPAPYWQTWKVNAIGNRTEEVRHGSTNTTYSYQYQDAGTPHGVTQVAATGGATWTRSYTYDPAGNSKTRPNAAGTAQTLSWDREGRLASLVEGGSTTSFVYDAEGNRLIRADVTGRTLYLPDGTEVRYTTSTGVKKATRYYGHADDVIAVRTSAGLNWVVGDHHGTAEVTINATTLAAAKRRTLPFGAARGSVAGTWPTAFDKGFVGGTSDSTGLVHLGAREYDPSTGAFISVDPIVDIADPQQWNAYSYSSHDPTNRLDPDGKKAFADGGGSGPSQPELPLGCAATPSCVGSGVGLGGNVLPKNVNYDVEAFYGVNREPKGGASQPLLPGMGNEAIQSANEIEGLRLASQTINRYTQDGVGLKDWAASVAVMRVNGVTQTVVFASFGFPDKAINQLNANGITVYRSVGGHFEDAYGRFSQDLTRTGQSYSVKSFYSTHQPCSDSCAAKTTNFIRGPNGKQNPNVTFTRNDAAFSNGRVISTAALRTIVGPNTSLLRAVPVILSSPSVRTRVIELGEFRIGKLQR